MTKPTAEEIASVEKEHGPCVEISHYDGSSFMFRALTRQVFDVREARARRRDLLADDGMLQMSAVWPSLAAWNEYDKLSAFETLSYAKAYKEIFGGKTVRLCFDIEIPADGNPDLKWLTNEEQTFSFRKPARSEVKMMAAAMIQRAEGSNIPDPMETLLRACGSPEFSRWIDDGNFFGIAAFGNAFVAAYGMQESTITPK